MWTEADELAFREDLIAKVITASNEGDGMLSRAELGSFQYAGQQVRVIDSQGGIWNPGAAWPFEEPLRATLSINTTTAGTYQDQEVTGGLWRYDYQAGSTAGKNTKLRAAMEFGFPVLWFQQQDNGRYVPYRVFIVQDFPDQGYCLMAPDQMLFLAATSESSIERGYAMREMKVRLHQPAFRARVISAYETRCAICQLRHGRLLDAAHITPDSETESSTSVNNGLALCKIHHAAYDADILGINSDYVVKVREDVLHEIDGPILKHGLIEMHDRELWLPSTKDKRPNKERLAARFEKFSEK
jgi:putative restriction endonuclease